MSFREERAEARQRAHGVVHRRKQLSARAFQVRIYRTDLDSLQRPNRPADEAVVVSTLARRREVCTIDLARGNIKAPEEGLH
jgi:hypothetical protein